MTNLNFTELDNCFKQNDFTSIENDHKGIRFLKLRSMSRKAIMEEFCKKHNINIKDLSSKKWLQHIFNLEGITDIKINNFINLKYKQGEVRFDASNRFFLVLTDKTDMTNSWKLKRNIIFLKEKINKHLDNLSMNMKNFETKFYWHKDQQTYNCKSDILFLKYGE